ncbi:MAG: hypothetical protein M0Q26_07365 [Chitinophagaceae bacterium]|nr:hypothetical protein [Chitinophagaceae bacterium]MDP1762790.1 hypothetical protein [Sediminibacterium sp.]MDP1809985.1 hypothetical protein [Sediminibacterium sp.]MDP3126956.1 hypothetical protein [Sediminibacterium sp.]MDP3665549.1 hypothetical protein [Sediminibacterium sp.]
MKNFVKRFLLFLLVVHGFGINVIGFIVYGLVFRTYGPIDSVLVLLISLQLNTFGFYYYQKIYPDMVTGTGKQLRSPWVIDFFRK